MKRWKVLISHSHAQAPLALRLKQHLEVAPPFAVFVSAEDIKPGERWEERLEAALQGTEVMICLVSLEWLTSRWCQQEFRMARSRGILLVPLCVGASETDRHPIEEHQWVLPKDHPHKDDEDWQRVTRVLVQRFQEMEVRELPRPSPPSLRMPDCGEERRERIFHAPSQQLTLVLRGNKVSYWVGDEDHPRQSTNWAPPPSGASPTAHAATLGELLLNSEGTRKAVFGGADYSAAPDASPWRLRIDTDAASEGLPWELITLKNQSLAAAGWTVERVFRGKLVPSVVLPPAFDLILLSPRNRADDPYGPAIEAHVRGLLHRIFGNAEEGDRHLRLVRTRSELAVAFRASGDTLLWIRADQDGDELLVDLEGGQQHLSLADFPVPRRPPLLVLVERPISSLGRLEAVPCLVTLSPSTQGPSAAWALLDLLQGLTEGCDPHVAAARNRNRSDAHALLQVYCRAGDWKTERPLAQLDEDRITQSLDRTNAKARALDAAGALCADSERRVLALLAMGDKGQPMEDVVHQLRKHLSSNLSDCLIEQVPIRAPLTNDVEKWQEVLRTKLDDPADLAEALCSRQRKTSGHTGKSVILLLYWGVVGKGAGRALDQTHYRAYLQVLHLLATALWKREQADGRSPHRVISLLSVKANEGGRDAKPAFAVVSAWPGQPGEEFGGASRNLAEEPLLAIGDVEVSDILRLLDDSRCSLCPRHDTRPVARAIHHHTGGDFQQVRDALIEALRFPARYEEWRKRDPGPPTISHLGSV